MKFFGTTFHQVIVKSKNELNNKKEKPFVVITSAAYDVIGDELESKGFQPRDDYCYCPEGPF